MFSSPIPLQSVLSAYLTQVRLLSGVKSVCSLGFRWLWRRIDKLIFWLFILCSYMMCLSVGPLQAFQEMSECSFLVWLGNWLLGVNLIGLRPDLIWHWKLGVAKEAQEIVIRYVMPLFFIPITPHSCDLFLDPSGICAPSNDFRQLPNKRVPPTYEMIFLIQAILKFNTIIIRNIEKWRVVKITQIEPEGVVWPTSGLVSLRVPWPSKVFMSVRSDSHWLPWPHPIAD